MLKPAVDQNNATLNMRCGDCLHFQGAPLYSEVCGDLGVQDFAPAPPCFAPDTRKLIESCDPQVIAVLRTIADTSDQQTLRLLAWQLSHAAEVTKSGFSFGQIVYFSLGGDYVTHYFKGQVIGQQQHGRMVIVSSRLRKAKKSTQCILMKDRVLTAEQWQAKVKELAKEDRIDVPADYKKWPKYKRSLAELLTLEGRVECDYNELMEKIGREVYEPPSIDRAPEEVLAAQRKRLSELNDDLKKKKPPVAKTKFNTHADGSISFSHVQKRIEDPDESTELASDGQLEEVEETADE